MSYEINSETFRTKKEITEKCQVILKSTPNGEVVGEESSKFLLEVFKFHDGYEEKNSGGVSYITTGNAEGGTRCFYLVKENGNSIDISFHYSITCIPKTAKNKK